MQFFLNSKKLIVFLCIVVLCSILGLSFLSKISFSPIYPNVVIHKDGLKSILSEAKYDYKNLSLVFLRNYQDAENSQVGRSYLVADKKVVTANLYQTNDSILIELYVDKDFLNQKSDQLDRAVMINNRELLINKIIISEIIRSSGLNTFRDNTQANAVIEKYAQNNITNILW